MKDISKIKYKMMAYSINPGGMGRGRSQEEIEEDFLYRIDWAKEQQKDEDKCFTLNNALFLGGFGEYITKEYFIEILDYLDLEWEYFESFIQKLRKQRIFLISTLWFDTLEFKTWYEADTYIKKKIEELR